MKKDYKNSVAIIEEIATKEIPELLKNKHNPDDYKMLRLKLNMEVIQVLIGGTFVENKGKKGPTWKIKFSSMPNEWEKSQVVNIMDRFVREVEDPYMNKLRKPYEFKDDIDIPAPSGSNQMIHKIDRINAKKLRNHIFGYEGAEAISTIMLNAGDCMALSAIGKDLRKKRQADMILIGGIALFVAGAVVSGMVYSKNHKDDEKPSDDIDDVNIDDSIVDMDDIESSIDEDDVPMVSID